VTGPHAPGTPHSAEHEAIKTESIAQASHGHPLLFSREDNSAACYKLEEATRATSYAALIKPFQTTKNGRDAWLALSNQWAENDKWEAERSNASTRQLLHARQWKGQSNFALEPFVAQHRNAFVSMQAAAKHVTHQLPNQHCQVGYLLDAIQCNDAGLQAAMASINTDQAVNRLENDFEAVAEHLIMQEADTSDATGEEVNVSSFGAKKGTGSSEKTLWHCTTKAECDLLDRAQKDELREWRKGAESKGANGKGKDDPSKN
jgi:hypothetical protein